MKKTTTIMDNKTILLIVLLSIASLSLVHATTVPTSIYTNIQTLDASGNIVTGTFTMQFNITTNANCSNVLYSNVTTQTTNNLGIVNYSLDNINVDFSQNLYLCYYRSGILKSANLMTSVPYSFRANNVSWVGVDGRPDSLSNFTNNLNFINSTGNETNRFQNLTSYGCRSGFVVNGTYLNGTVMCVADANSGATNIFNQQLNTSSNVLFGNLTSNGNITAVTFFGSGSGLTNINTHNQTYYDILQNLTAYDCPSGNLVIGIQNNGSVLCATDANSGASNIFNQVLNTSSNVQFGNVTSKGNVTAVNFYGDGSGITGILYNFNQSNILYNFNQSNILYNYNQSIRNETNRFQNLTSYDCASGFVVQGVQDNGTVLCIADANSAGVNLFNQQLNTTNNVQFSNLTIINGGNITLSGNATIFGNVSLGLGAWFRGLFNWIIDVNPSARYITFNGSTLTFSESNLNATIDARRNYPIDQNLNTTYNAKFSNFTSTGNLTLSNNLTFINTGTGQVLNTTSYQYWNATGCLITIVGGTKDWICP